MAGHKLSAAQQRQVDNIEQFMKTVSHVKGLVAELESNRAARAQIVDNICGAIARELSQMRQRTLTANIGTIGDVAGALAVMASRGGGLNMKIRGLNDGVNSLTMQLDQAMKAALQPEDKGKDAGHPA